MHKNTILSYADNTVVISGDDTWASAQEKMNKFLDKIANWLVLNKLSLNTNETVYKAIVNYCDSLPRKIEIEIHKQKIIRVTDCKYLVIIFDFNMKLDKHIQYIINKTKYLIFVCKNQKIHGHKISNSNLLLLFSQLHKLWYNRSVLQR